MSKWLSDLNDSGVLFGLILIALFAAAGAVLHACTPRLLRMARAHRALLSTLIISSPLIVLVCWIILWAIFVGDM